MIPALQLGQFGRTVATPAGGGAALAVLLNNLYGAGSSGTTLAANFSISDPSAGSHIFVSVRWESTDTTTSCADSQGNTYTALTARFEKNVGFRWFYCLNASLANGMTVTATWGASRSFRRIQGVVLTGAASSVTEYAVQSQSGATVISTPSISAAAGNLIVAGEGSYWGDSTRSYLGLSGSWTVIGTTNVCSNATAAFSSAASGAVQYTGQNTSADGRILSALLVA